MAFRLVKHFGGGSSGGMEYAKKTGTAIAQGDLLFWSTNGLTPCDASNERTYNVEAVAMAAASSGAAVVVAIPLCDDQLWEADCTATITTTMLGETQLMTSGGTVNNNATEDTTTSAVVKIIGYAGALTDKRALVRVQRSDYKTS